MKKTYTGSCHCGAIRFTADLDLAAGTTRCNCGFCKKARWWMAFAKLGDVTITQGEADMGDYRYTSPTRAEPFLHFHFCKTCGFRPFTRGGALPQLGGEFYAVNIACLDGISDEELAALPVAYVDGRHDAWDRAPEITGYL
jgi:hypothetical protein